MYSISQTVMLAWRGYVGGREYEEDRKGEDDEDCILPEVTLLVSGRAPTI
jgi:hypothetical protein